MEKFLTLFFFVLFVQLLSAQQTDYSKIALKVVEKISSDEMEGRRTGSSGITKAREYLISQFTDLGYQVKLDTFYFNQRKERLTAVNIIVEKVGKVGSKPSIVVSAHYDHLGIINDEIFNGTDDNASGIGALVALATFLKTYSNEHTIQLVALDAEEMGLRGAYHYVKNATAPKENIALNINLDMISQSEKNELYACGTHYYPFLKPIADKTADTFINLTVKFGHDLPGSGSDNWTKSSDHYPFYLEQVPFIYFGVEDHPYYHQPDDTFDIIHKEFYFEVINFITAFLVDVDKTLE